MAYILKLHSDGLTDVDFLDGTNFLLEDGGLKIGKPSQKETWVGSGSYMQGRELSGVSYDNRRIEITFEIMGDDRSDVLDKKTRLGRFISDSHVNQLTKLRPEVELQMQIDDSSNKVTFDVVDGEIELPDDYMSVEKQYWTTGAASVTLKGVRMALICKPFARGDEVTLVDHVGIKNVDDGSGNNYVSWSASAVDGDVPGPIDVQIQTSEAKEYLMGWMALRDTTLFDWYEHMKEPSTLYAGGSSGANATSANDTIVSWSTASLDTATKLCRFTMVGAAAEINAGPHRVLAVGKFPTDCKFQLRVTNATDSVVLRTYPWVRPTLTYTNPGILDMGVIEKVPHHVEWGVGTAGFYFQLWVQADDATTKNISLDCLIFMHANDYKYRAYRMADGAGMTTTRDIVDFATKDKVFIDTDVYDYESVVDYDGLPIHANPSEGSRLYFTFVDDSYEWNAEDDFTITVDHTPYYLDVRGDD